MEKWDTNQSGVATLQCLSITPLVPSLNFEQGFSFSYTQEENITTILNLVLLNAKKFKCVLLLLPVANKVHHKQIKVRFKKKMS